MSDNVCYVDAYARSIQARLRAVEPPAAEGKGALVLLDRTVFYPGGGGQPADRGTLRTSDGRTWQVVAARKVGDEIWHELEPGTEPPPAAVGASDALALFTADVDWERRLRLMRTHTALHALCGVVWRDYGALVTGGMIIPDGHLAIGAPAKVRRPLTADEIRAQAESAAHYVEFSKGYL